MHLTHALSKFTVQLEADGRSPHTIAQYGRHVRALSTWLGSKQVSSIDHEVLAQFLASPDARTRPDGQPKRAGSMNALRTSMRTFFGYLADAGVVDTNPARLIRRARCGAPLPKALSEADQKRLLRTIAAARGAPAERDAVLVQLMLGTGIRLGSALALQIEDVDLTRGDLLLRHAKGDREVRVFLPPAMRQLLRRFLRGRAEGPVFQGRPGQPLCARQFQVRFAAWQERAGIRPVSPHALRHTFAMRLYRGTRDLLIVKEALGHRSITSTMVYVGVAGRRAV
jgi:site-specific recombinase XerD